MSEAYNRVRDNQLAEPPQIKIHPDATPLVRNIRPHGNYSYIYILRSNKIIEINYLLNHFDCSINSAVYGFCFSYMRK